MGSVIGPHKSFRPPWSSRVSPCSRRSIGTIFKSAPPDGHALIGASWGRSPREKASRALDDGNAWSLRSLPWDASHENPTDPSCLVINGRPVQSWVQQKRPAETPIQDNGTSLRVTHQTGHLGLITQRGCLNPPPASEDHIDPATSALSGRLGDSPYVSTYLFLCQSILVARVSSCGGGTERNGTRRTRTQLLG